jgi:hypothetical protein
MPQVPLLLMMMVAANPAPAPATDPLQPLAFLVGACWSGDFPNGAGRDTHCFEPVFGGKFVRDRHLLRGKRPDYAGETLYAWDAKQQRIAFWYWSSDGDFENGSALPAADGLDFPEHSVEGPTPITLRAHWRRLDADHYETIQERKDGDTWRSAWKVEYHRVPGAHGDPAAVPR